MSVKELNLLGACLPLKISKGVRPMAKESFAESFQKLIYKRMEYNGSDLVVTPEYQTLRHRVIELEHMVAEILGPENRELMSELDELTGRMELLSEDHAYKSGFREALEFKQIINTMGIPLQEEARCQ